MIDENQPRCESRRILQMQFCKCFFICVDRKPWFGIKEFFKYSKDVNCIWFSIQLSVIVRNRITFHWPTRINFSAFIWNFSKIYQKLICRYKDNSTNSNDISLGLWSYGTSFALEHLKENSFKNVFCYKEKSLHISKICHRCWQIKMRFMEIRKQKKFNNISLVSWISIFRNVYCYTEKSIITSRRSWLWQKLKRFVEFNSNATEKIKDDTKNSMVLLWCHEYNEDIAHFLPENITYNISLKICRYKRNQIYWIKEFGSEKNSLCIIDFNLALLVG